MKQDYQVLLVQVIDAVKTSGNELREKYGNIESLVKTGVMGVSSVVTELDRKTEAFLKEKFFTFAPDIAFRGEEFGGDDTNQ